MTDLVALGVQSPQINTVGNFQQAQNNAIQQQGAEMQQHAAALEQIATMGLGIMGGKLDGPIDPDKLKQGIALLGNNPLAAKLQDNPELLRTITSGSLNVLQYAQNQQQFKLAMEQFDRELQSTDADIALKKAQTAQINNGGKIIPGQPIYSSDGTISYPTEYGGTRPLTLPGAAGAPDPNAPAPAAPLPSRAPLTAPATAAPAAAPAAAPTAAAAAPITVGAPQDPLIASLPISKPAPIVPPHILTPAEIEGQKTTATEQAKLDTAKPKEMVAAKNALDDLDHQDSIVSGYIDQALKQAQDAIATGFVGKLSEGVPGSPAYKLARTMDTIKANIGFDKLQALRNSSPSGGALGQVSNFEEQLLQSVSGSLDQGQDAATVMANLQKMKSYLGANSTQRHAAFEADFSGVAPPSGDPAFNTPTTPASASKPVDMGNGVTIQEMP